MTDLQIPEGVKKVGEIAKEVKDTLDLDFSIGTPIYRTN